MVIVGIDEAGRGPLAGPVVSACVYLDDQRPISGLNDSKKLKAKDRERLYAEIMSSAKKVAISVVSSEIIDDINILEATFLSMKQAILEVNNYIKIDIALIDGCHTVKGLSNIEQKAIIKGDTTEPAIMAASIIAKVHRDRLMEDLADLYPAYGFQKHKGYGTKLHLAAICTHGPCPVHRKTFAPMKYL